jgi:hypothetical protein
VEIDGRGESHQSLHMEECQKPVSIPVSKSKSEKNLPIVIHGANKEI